MDKKTDELFENTILELRRGLIVLAVLSQLGDEQYGYSLIKRLCDKGLKIDQGTLYPLLRRMETQGLHQSARRVEDDRPRRYYVINPAGKEILPRLKYEWYSLVEMMDGMLKVNEGGENG